MFKRSIVAGLAVALCSLGLSLNINNSCNAETVVKNTACSEKQEAKLMETTTCTGIVVQKHKDGLVLRSDKDQQLLQINFSEEMGKETKVYTARKGKLSKLGNIKVGDQVRVLYGCAMTRSIPPQALGLVIVKGKAGDIMPNFLEVQAVTKLGQGDYVELISAQDELIATVDAKACADYASIKAGDQLLLWYNYVTMSLPPRTNAARAIIIK